MRNYKKENEWAKQRYEHISCSIDKKLGQDLKAKLKKQNKSIANWITENAKTLIYCESEEK